MFVQPLVDGSQVDGHIRVALLEMGNPLGGADQADEFDPAHPPMLQDIYRRDG